MPCLVLDDNVQMGSCTENIPFMGKKISVQNTVHTWAAYSIILTNPKKYFRITLDIRCLDSIFPVEQKGYTPLLKQAKGH